MGKQRKVGQSGVDRIERRFDRMPLAKMGERKAGPPVHIQIH